MLCIGMLQMYGTLLGATQVYVQQQAAAGLSLKLLKCTHHCQMGIAVPHLLCNVQCLEEAGTNQVLIFVHSRKETYKTAKFLQEEAMRNDDLAKFVPSSSASREVLQVLLPDGAAAFVCCCC